MNSTMKKRLKTLKNTLKKKAANVMFFGYAVVAGTSVPILLSRCSSNCLSCGNCALVLGILPLVLVVTAKDHLNRKVKRMSSFLRRDKKK